MDLRSTNTGLTIKATANVAICIDDAHLIIDAIEGRKDYQACRLRFELRFLIDRLREDIAEVDAAVGKQFPLDSKEDGKDGEEADPPFIV